MPGGQIRYDQYFRVSLYFLKIVNQRNYVGMDFFNHQPKPIMPSFTGIVALTSVLQCGNVLVPQFRRIARKDRSSTRRKKIQVFFSLCTTMCKKARSIILFKILHVSRHGLSCVSFQKPEKSGYITDRNVR